MRVGFSYEKDLNQILKTVQRLRTVYTLGGVSLLSEITFD